MSCLRLIITCLLFCTAVLSPRTSHAVNSEKAAGLDSTHFVTAWLMVVTPGSNIYSSFGHCVLHLQCPSKGLDYVFTFETEPNYLKFFVGQSKACFVAVPTKDFLLRYEKEGRGVTEYELNLTPHEKQELWRLLDEDMMGGVKRRFTMLKSNCVSMSLLMIERALEKRYIDFSHNNWLLQQGNARILHSYLKDNPWADFIFFTFSGTEADKSWTVEELLSPTNIGHCLQTNWIVSTQGNQRWPVIIGRPHRIMEAQRSSYSSWFTPNVLALLILLSIAAISIAGHVNHQGRLQRATDAALLVFQTAIGLILLYVTLVTCLFGRCWNWYLIPFNPIPILVWLCFRNRPNYNAAYLAYTIILLLFIIISPFVTRQVDIAHLFLVAALMLRCGDKYYSWRKNKFNINNHSKQQSTRK